MNRAIGNWVSVILRRSPSFCQIRIQNRIQCEAITRQHEHTVWRGRPLPTEDKTMKKSNYKKRRNRLWSRRSSTSFIQKFCMSCHIRQGIFWEKSDASSFWTSVNSNPRNFWFYAKKVVIPLATPKITFRTAMRRLVI